MNLNKVFLIGNLSRDVTLRNTASGASVADFGVATNRNWIGSDGKKQQEVEFHNIVVWGKLAELCHQYLAKGRLVFIEGRLRTRSWQDSSGQKRWKTEIVVGNIQFGPRFGNSSENINMPSSNTKSKKEETTDDLPTLEEDSSENVNPDDIPF